jgi:hypothetical protein
MSLCKNGIVLEKKIFTNHVASKRQGKNKSSKHEDHLATYAEGRDIYARIVPLVTIPPLACQLIHM